MALSALYKHSLSLLTDLYQLTMANGYWHSGRRDDEAVFHLFFRNNPFAGGYAIAAGLAQVSDFVKDARFDDGDVDFLETLTGRDGKVLFARDFLDHLRTLEFSCDVDAVPEGTPVFAHEPLLRVRGPLVQCQILETALLNIINFQTLIATKAARICQAAQGEPILEMGLRRAQGIDGSLMASRAAFIGGSSATSNVLAGKLFGIPVRGTHAHSWVMAFDDEPQAFAAYAKAMPNNCVFLVDTYDTIEGVKHAIAVGRHLKARGQQLVGIRLDSGDLAWLSIQARVMLDEAGLQDAAIIASNELDEYTIQSLKNQDAKIGVWGVGTKLITAFDQPALGGVYKLAALRPQGGEWQPKIKLSEQAIKTSVPGHLQVRRYVEKSAAAGNAYLGDMIYDEMTGVESPTIVDPKDPTRQRDFEDGGGYQDLLQPVFRGGRYVGDDEPLEAIQRRAASELQRFHSGIRRFDNPHEYPVGLETSLHDLRARLIMQARGQST